MTDIVELVKRLDEFASVHASYDRRYIMARGAARALEAQQAEIKRLKHTARVRDDTVTLLTTAAVKQQFDLERLRKPSPAVTEEVQELRAAIADSEHDHPWDGRLVNDRWYIDMPRHVARKILAHLSEARQETARPAVTEEVVEALRDATAALSEIHQCSVAGALHGYGNPMLWGDALYKSHGPAFDAIKRAKAALSHLSLSTETVATSRYPEEAGWLVEMKDCGPVYYSYEGRDEDSPWGGFDRDVNKAVRFARKQDAEALIAAVGWTPGHVYAAEHSWGGERIVSTGTVASDGQQDFQRS